MRFILDPLTREFREVVIYEWIPFLIYGFSSLALAYLVSLKLGDFLYEKINRLDDGMKKTFATFMLIGTIITLALFFIIVFLQDMPVDIVIRNIIYASLLAVYFISLIFTIFAFTDSIHKEEELNRHKETLTDLQEYTETIEDMATGLRGFRHDHRNILLGFKELIDTKNIDGIKNYYQLHMISFTESTAIADSRLEGLKRIERPELKSVISAKLIHAQHSNINVHIEVPDVIKGISDFHIVDLCRVMGILIDNSIEACQEMNSPVLSFLAMANDSGILFLVKNKCPPNMPTISEIFTEGFSTKSTGRGIGVNIVTKLCEKNDDLSFRFNISEGDFIQEVFVLT